MTFRPNQPLGPQAWGGAARTAGSDNGWAAPGQPRHVLQRWPWLWWHALGTGPLTAATDRDGQRKTAPRSGSARNIRRRELGTMGAGRAGDGVDHVGDDRHMRIDKEMNRAPICREPQMGFQAPRANVSKLSRTTLVKAPFATGVLPHRSPRRTGKQRGSAHRERTAEASPEQGRTAPVTAAKGARCPRRRRAPGWIRLRHPCCVARKSPQAPTRRPEGWPPVASRWDTRSKPRSRAPPRSPV